MIIANFETLSRYLTEKHSTNNCILIDIYLQIKRKMRYILIISILTCLILGINCALNICVPLSTTSYPENDTNECNEVNIYGPKIIKIGNSNDEKFSDEQLYEELGNDIRNTLIKNGTIYIDHVDLDVVHEAFRINGTMDNLTITNLDDYTLCLLILHSTDMDLFNFTLNNFTIVGEYNITGNIGDLFDIFGDGDFWMTMTNFSVAMTHFNLQVDEELCFNISLDITLGAVHNYFYNMMGDQELGDLMNEVMEAIMPESLEIIWGEIKDRIDGPLEKMINDWLHKKSLQEFFQRKMLSSLGLFNFCING